MASDDPKKHANGGTNGTNGADEPEGSAEIELGDEIHDERDTIVDLHADVNRDVDHDLARHAPAPAAVAELFASCVRFVGAKYKIALDFSPDTLSVVDQYVRDAREDLKIKPEALDLLQATIGAYLGEVLRRAFGGEWFCDGEHDGWRLDMTYVYLTFNPIGMAREALMLHTADGWHGHLETEEAEREVLEGRLKLLADVDEEEYFAPTTRFDVVEIAVDALRAKMVQDGHGDVRFTRDDYRTK
jgi:hypothetical protein